MAASVKARLQNLAAERGVDFNLLLTRFGIERLLYRLSRSQHADKFLLKGAMLFLVWDERTHRPTRDLDLLGFGPTEVSDLVDAFREVVTTSVEADGLAFDPASVRAETIREDDAYGGVRVRLIGTLGTVHIPIQVDVGVGDAVTPAPDDVIFPALLDLPAPRIRAYPIYTVLAEKLEAIVSLGAANTRMKDFYDVLFLSTRFKFDQPMLRSAIRSTFVRRGTHLPPNLAELSNNLQGNPAKQTQWRAFLRRNSLTGVPPAFEEALTMLRGFTEPLLQD